MKTFTSKDGKYSAKYDDSFKVGDLITAYQKGYHEFVKYQERGETAAPLIYYRRVFKFNGRSAKSKKVLCCDAVYCHKASEHIKNLIKNLHEQIKLLEQIPA
jgi:hypothetical protein